MFETLSGEIIRIMIPSRRMTYTLQINNFQTNLQIFFNSLETKFKFCSGTHLHKKLQKIQLHLQPSGLQNVHIKPENVIESSTFAHVLYAWNPRCSFRFYY